MRFYIQKINNLYKKILSADYQLPNSLSKQAADLIKKILTTDPEKRIKITEIKKHPWFESVKTTLSKDPGTIIGIDPAPVDSVILKDMESLF